MKTSYFVMGATTGKGMVLIRNRKIDIFMGIV
jgi:hypothetical protein